jgi:hypothetical protein
MAVTLRGLPPPTFLQPVNQLYPPPKNPTIRRAMGGGLFLEVHMTQEWHWFAVALALLLALLWWAW